MFNFQKILPLNGAPMQTFLINVTNLFSAPEIVKNERYSYGVDWWGVGCLIYEMIEGKAPFRQRKEKVKREEVERRVREDQEKYSEKFSEAARTLCRLVILIDSFLKK